MAKSDTPNESTPIVSKKSDKASTQPGTSATTSTNAMTDNTAQGGRDSAFISKVAANMGVALATMAFGGPLLYFWILPDSHKFTSVADGLGCGARLLSISALTLVFSVMAVGLTRLFNSSECNPASPSYTPSAIIKLRAQFLQNTLEQFVIHAAAVLSLSTVVADCRLLVCLCIAFVIGRILFAVGYSIQPYHRAAGFALTFLPSIIALIYVASTTISQGFSGTK
ncbi:hypothetical protein H4219_006176 [Mycoemilia scoparia]|uniref:MAPEG family protein n=1 Tax=Mycoemilia scoparia TaxID=417184 RepID=A0A9W8DMR7_9FUNG|nr:hypothetical protein H4219_006176 [Mycoemilia scoparia]